MKKQIISEEVLKMQKIAGIITESQFKEAIFQEEEQNAQDLKVGQFYIASMPAVADDGDYDAKSRVDVKVKYLRPSDSSVDKDLVIVKTTEDKYYVDPNTKDRYKYDKDGEYAVRPKYLKPIV